MAQAADNQSTDGAGVAKPYFGFGGVHIDIDLCGRQRQKQHDSRMPVARQKILIGAAHSAGQKLVAHGTPIDDKMLPRRRALMQGRQPRIAFKHHAFAFC